MSKILEREMRRLEQEILRLSAVVEENVLLAMQALERRDAAQAGSVLKKDKDVDRIEVQLEEECLKILALHQPVANDLRAIVSCLKINNDLERVGDLAVTIARRAEKLCELPDVPLPANLTEMGAGALRIFGQSIDCFVKQDRKLAETVCRDDETVDEMHRVIQDAIKDMIREQPEVLEQALHLLRVARALERIGDHATNIAEDVIYMLEGNIVRHSI
jgi:phosphate transport system protein